MAYRINIILPVIASWFVYPQTHLPPGFDVLVIVIFIWFGAIFGFNTQLLKDD